MALVTLFSAGTFKGLITNTPSGTAYSIAPNQVIIADIRDIALLSSYDLIAYPATSSFLSAPQLLTVSSGNFIVPSGVTLINGTMVGGGGGGGGVAAATAGAASGSSGALLSFTAIVTPGQIIPFACGAAGIGGAAGNNPGATGGDTTFLNFTAKGGAGGAGSASGNATGNTTGQTLIQQNGSAAIPTATTFITGMGQFYTGLAAQGTGTGASGRGIWGVGGSGGNNAAGASATGFGAPGGGAGSTGASAFAGGDGTAGAILIF